MSADEVYEELPDEAECEYEDLQENVSTPPRLAPKQTTQAPPKVPPARSSVKAKNHAKPAGAKGPALDLSAISSGKKGLKKANVPAQTGLCIQQNDVLSIKNNLRPTAKNVPAKPKNNWESEKVYDVNPNDFRSVLNKFKNKDGSTNGNDKATPTPKPKPKPPPTQKRTAPQNRSLPPVPMNTNNKSPPDEEDQEYDDSFTMKAPPAAEVEGEEYDDTSMLRSPVASEPIGETYDDTSVIKNARASSVSNASSTGSGEGPALPPRSGNLRDSDPQEEQYEAPDEQTYEAPDDEYDDTPSPPKRPQAQEQQETYEEVPEVAPTSQRKPPPPPVQQQEEEAYEELPEEKTPAPPSQRKPPPPPMQQQQEEEAYEELPEDKSPAPPPIPPSSRPLPQTPVDPISREPWAFLDLTRDQAEALIEKEKKEGLFLVRGSTHGHKYTITMWYKSKIWNLPVKDRPGGRIALGAKKEKEVTFKELPDLISHYCQKKLTLLDKHGEVVGYCRLTTSPSK